jgi:hypothetical protein
MRMSRVATNSGEEQRLVRAINSSEVEFSALTQEGLSGFGKRPLRRSRFLALSGLLRDAADFDQQEDRNNPKIVVRNFRRK